MDTQGKFGSFVEDSTLELGKIVAVAADLPKGQSPEVGAIRTGHKRAFCFATTRAWKGFGDMPLPSDSPLMSREAAGFMCAHDCLAAERALTAIMREKGKTLSDLGRESWELVLPDTFREIVSSGRLCSDLEWKREFDEQRKCFPAGICVTLSLTEQEDGSYRASAGVKLDCVHFGFVRICDIERTVESVSDVRELAREAVGHVFPWILTPESGEKIEARDAEPVRKALEERKDQNLPDIPRWISEMAEQLVKEMPINPDNRLPAEPEKPRVSMRM